MSKEVPVPRLVLHKDAEISDSTLSQSLAGTVTVEHSVVQVVVDVVLLVAHHVAVSVTDLGVP